MTERYSVPERFVDTWALVQRIPKIEAGKPGFHTCRELQDQAEMIIEEALRRATALAYVAKNYADREGEAAAREDSV